MAQTSQPQSTWRDSTRQFFITLEVEGKRIKFDYFFKNGFEDETFEIHAFVQEGVVPNPNKLDPNGQGRRFFTNGKHSSTTIEHVPGTTYQFTFQCWDVAVGFGAKAFERFQRRRGKEYIPPEPPVLSAVRFTIEVPREAARSAVIHDKGEQVVEADIDYELLNRKKKIDDWHENTKPKLKAEGDPNERYIQELIDLEKSCEQQIKKLEGEDLPEETIGRIKQGIRLATERQKADLLKKYFPP